VIVLEAGAALLAVLAAVLVIVAVWEAE